MLQYDLSAQVRNKFGKGANRCLRSSGATPAVLYGSHVDPVHLQFDCKDLTHTLLQMQRRNAIFNLDIAGVKRHVMVKEIQTKPVDDSLLHVDFHEIKLDTPTTFEVPLKFSGKAKGVDLGGELHIGLPNVTLQGLPLDIPDYIEINISALNIGDQITCSALTMPADIEIKNDKDAVCIAVIHATVKASDFEDEEAEDETAAQPETEKAE